MTDVFDGQGSTPATQWSDFRTRLPELPIPGTGHRVLVVAAHPDDETLGAGGLLAAAEARGAAITVLVASDGDASHPRSPTHSPRDLAHMRRREVYAALAALAPSAEVVLLGLPDGRLDEHLDELTTQITEAGGECTHIVTPWVGDRHPDHEACARAAEHVVAASGAKHWQYPIWAWHWGGPDAVGLPAGALRTVSLDAAARAAKERAISCYPSQCAPLSDQPGDEAVLPAGMLAHFRTDLETFVVAASPDASSPEYFAALYEESRDPWGLERRFYERRKRQTVLASLTRTRFGRAFEPGCATGLLTAELAARCDQVVAWDVAQIAVDAARERLAGMPGVTIERGQVPGQWPDGRFDLLVLSEIGYYCPDLTELVRRVDESLDENGVLVACHWRHSQPRHPHTAGAVHGALGANRQVVVSHVESDFLLHVWTRTGTSVAAAEGLVH